MKLVSFELEGNNRLAILVDEKIYPVSELNPNIPHKMADFLKAGDEIMEMAKSFDDKIRENPDKFNGYWLKNAKLLAPVPHPTSCRDGYAFRQHVMTARRNRGLEMIEEFDQFPIFYQSQQHYRPR
jgi:fumarylacetoacetate (FAA) hydrolase